MLLAHPILRVGAGLVRIWYNVRQQYRTHLQEPRPHEEYGEETEE